MNYDIIEATSFEEVLSEIEENSKYKRLPPKEKNWMTVPEMGNLLGLKKTGRYWLVQKNYFECREIAGQMRVNIASFEKWYANQVKYHKVNGEEPGKNLKKWSYSISEVAKMLGISETTVYDLIRRDGIKTVTVDYWIRIPKKSFQEWYEKQSKYRTQKDREKDKELEGATITMPEMARLQVILACYKEFEERVGLMSEKNRSTVYDVVKNYVTEKIGKFTGAEVIAACPIGSRSAVLNALNKLTKEEIIVKCGSGRGTFYVRKDAMENENLPQ